MTSLERLALALASGLLWCLVLLAVGARARRLARLPARPGERQATDFVLGGWVVGATMLLCGLLGAFRPAVLLLAAGGLAACGRWKAPVRWRDLAPPGAACVVLLPLALAPPFFFYDALVYHLALPWQALQDGRIAPHPEDLFAAFPPLAQLVAAAPLAAGLDRVPALLHLASFVLAGGALAALARRVGAPSWMAALAGAALPLLPALALVPGLPAAEGWLLAALLAALSIALDPRERPGRAALAGFLLGCGSAARLQGIAWTLIGIGVLAASSRRPLRRAAAAAAGAIAGSAPWWLKNLLLLGSPFAPVGWRREGIETLWRDAGSLMYAAPGAGGLARALVAALAPHLSYLLPLSLAALLALVSGRARPCLLLGAAALAGLLAWGATGTLPRFLAPTLAALLALTAAAGRTPAGRWAGGLVLASVTALGMLFTLREVKRLGIVPAGLEGQQAAAEAMLSNDPLPVFEAAGLLPADSRALFVGEPRGFPFPRRFVCPSQHDVSPLRGPLERLPSAEAVRDWLLQQGYTHLLINRGELARLAGRYPVLPWASEAGRLRFQELLDLLAPSVARAGEAGLFALGP